MPGWIQIMVEVGVLFSFLCILYAVLFREAGRSDVHIYLSTACRHDDHEYCASNTGSNGEKVPAVCKFCQAPCVCRCHGK